jgi:glycosyltransferase involved in cell wall biosynthesis
LVKHFTRTKILFICHNVLPHERKSYDLPLTKLAFSQADSFIVHSADDRKDLENLVKNKQIMSGFLPIFNMLGDNKKYDVAKIKKDLKLKKKVLIFFGYIRPYKGLKYLLEAMPNILKN